MEKWTREDMERDYPYFRRFVYDKLREYFDKNSPPINGDDLQAAARAMNAVPFESFIHEFDVDLDQA